MREIEILSAVSTVRSGQPYATDFVFPSLACVLAASRVSLGCDPVVEFTGDSRIYAEHSGLLNALAGRYDAMVRPRSSTEGRTWSHLTTLYQHAEIESCNQTINDVLFTQLAEMPPFVLDQRSTHQRALTLSSSRLSAGTCRRTGVGPTGHQCRRHLCVETAQVASACCAHSSCG
jgi:hypothetical protein